MGKIIDLDEIIDDELEGRWFHYMRMKDFAWMNRIPDQHKLEVEEDDIIVHKEIQDDSRYPTIRYHQVLEDEAFLVDGDDVREIMKESLSKYLKEHNKLPFGCEYKKVFKNGKVQVNYNPTGYDNFTLKLDPEDLPKEHMELEDPDSPSIDESMKYFENLDSDDNALETIKVEHDVGKIEDASVLEQVANESGKGSVMVFGTTIKEVDVRKSIYQGHENVYYVMRVEGGEVAPDKKKSTLRRELKEANVKCSDSSFEKYDLKVGKVISFNSKLKNDSDDGIILQRIMKFYDGAEM